MTEATLAPTTEPASVFESDLPLDAKLEKARTELLDLSARNRLLNIPRSAKSAKTLEVVDERGAEAFRLLVRENKAFTFLPGKGATPDTDEDGEIIELAQPEDDGVDARGVANRHADTRLQTRLTPAGLQKRLLDLYYDARTLEEEQGVNILFLAIGTLKWIDPNNATAVRYAPLILVPVELERGNAAEKFKLRVRQEDFAANLSLEAYLDRVHGLKLPTFEAGDEFDPTGYAAAVAEAVSAKAGWSVNEDDIVLGFFSFAKFLMYRDLDPQTWPGGAKLVDHPLIRPLVSDGFPEGEPLLSEDESIDVNIAPSNMTHIVDSDSSQTLAVEEVRRGRDLVIQGPPGTGKSQTIANVIASAVADGKTVLFVAEKMAALEVVKRRLDSTGVGDACLELHSNKANKRAVLEELRRTWELGAPRTENLDALNARLTEARDHLNAHVLRLHRPIGSAALTPYDVIGHLVRLKQGGVKPGYLQLDGAEDWTKDAFDQRSALVAELAERVLDLGAPGNHLWRGVELTRAIPTDVARLERRLTTICEQLTIMGGEHSAISDALQIGAPETLEDLTVLATLVDRIATAPSLQAEALEADIWDRPDAVREILSSGAEYARLRDQLAPLFNDAAWTAALDQIRSTLAPLDASTPVAAFARAGVIAGLLPGLLEQGQRLAEAVGRETAPKTIQDLETLAQVGERVAHAPDADPVAFAQDLWDNGVERASDLAAAVKILEDARSEVGSGLSENAWSADLAAARSVLAAHGDSFLRLFSGEWRAADRLVRSFQSEPKAPLTRRLALLDALANGQAALKVVRDDADFGRTAFASDWRGERSESAPLRALVEWMRSLRGLGAEPRLIVGARPDRRRLDDLSMVLTAELDAVRPELSRLWDDAGSGRAVFFGAAGGPDVAELSAARDACRAIAEVYEAAEALTVSTEPSLAVRRQALDDLARGQAAAAALAAGEPAGRAAFGANWQGAQSNWDTLTSAADWLVANADIRHKAARIPDRPDLKARSDAALSLRDKWIGDVETLLVDLKGSAEAAVTAERLSTTPVSLLGTHLAAWRGGGEALTSWVGYRARAREANSMGLADLIARLHDGQLAPVDAHDDFEQAFFEAVLEQHIKVEPELAAFQGELHGRRVREFVDLDRQKIRVAASQVARAHHRRIPPLGGGAVGPLGVLKAEMARRRGHMPIRQLMQKAAQPVQALKPVFMMSPLSVAQFLPPGGLKFDLLVMDEASQIQPVDALGAIARCKQVVVVGEGPVHFDELVVRIRTAWGAGRAGGRIREAVRRAVDVSCRQGRIVADGDFLSTPGAEISVRDRSEASSPTLRRPDMLPPAEIESALIDVVSRNFGATEDQALQAVARAFGFKATSAQLREVLGAVLKDSLERGVLIRRDTLIDAAPNSPKAKREPERRALESLIAEGEGERLELKETLRWDLRQSSVNRKLEDAAMKAIAAFSNHRGGTLLIGVADGGTVKGLEPDLGSFGGSRDRFELHLTNLIKDRFSESFRAGCVSVSYPILGQNLICRVDVKRSRTPVYLSLSEGNNPPLERLIVRAGASSPEIPLSQVATYVRDHFS